MCSGHLPFFLHRFAAVWHMRGRFGRIPACRIYKVAASYRPGPAESTLFRCPLGPVGGHICMTPRFCCPVSVFGVREKTTHFTPLYTVPPAAEAVGFPSYAALMNALD